MVYLDRGEHLLVPIAPTGIGVHFIDQLLNAALAIAGYGSRCAQRGSHKLVVDHQAAEVPAGNELLADHSTPVLLRASGPQAHPPMF